ncbi:hypothetical protein SCATT_55720 [Streptantibioticus cattleyicolor NRRL 8057 = DSM 46488]|uniref:Uncharacterized protein n=1 Tax=Streptantibioticus cattleyicolor (strain ATCC 35852 / DSM 46488 / JCM 4925 / NBRC 14057 / NRRL 8057) TaxID=1003195 RepID=G8X175_STREN|nr:hypothetical protein SCATT_55720 [Streptantibioticus cattleyicolor NRRL 8057 = DSM 46488]
MAAAEVADEEVAAGGDVVAPETHHGTRVLVVVDVVQDRAEDDGDRAPEVDQPAGDGVVEDDLRVAHVGPDDAGEVVLLQQGAAVGEHDGVVVDVEHPGRRRVALGHLVHVVGGRQAAAHVDELADRCVQRDVPHRAHQRPAVGVGDGDRPGHLVLEPVTDLPVDGVVVLAAEQIVVDTGDARLRLVHLADGVGHPTAPSLPGVVGAHHRVAEPPATAGRGPYSGTNGRVEMAGKTLAYSSVLFAEPLVFTGGAMHYGGGPARRAREFDRRRQRRQTG